MSSFALKFVGIFVYANPLRTIRWVRPVAPVPLYCAVFQGYV